MIDNFYSILRIQDEVFFVLTLGGSWLFLRHTTSNRQLFPIGLLGIFLLGVLWRLFCPVKLVSRYSAVLIYPTVMICGYALAYLYRNDCRVFKYRFSGKWVLLILLTAITVYVGVKLARTRPKSFKIAAETVRRDCGASSGSILCTRESSRFGYYSGVETRQLPEQIMSGDPKQIVDALKREVRFSHYRADRIYVIAILPRKNTELTELLNDDRDLRLLSDMEFRKGSPQRMLILAERPRPELNLQRAPIPNGDFSVPLNASRNRDAREGLIRRGIGFFKDEKILLPDKWYVYSTDTRAEVYLKKDRSDNVLKLHTDHWITLVYGGRLTFSPHLRGLGFMAAGKSKTEATVKVWKITEKNTQGTHVPVAEICLATEKKFYEILLDDCGLKPEDVFSFEIIFRNGDAEVDDFLLLYDDMGHSVKRGNDE